MAPDSAEPLVDRPASPMSVAGSRPVIALRAVEPGDLDRFFRQQLDPEANAMAAFGSRDPFDRAAFDAKWSRILGDEGTVVRTITVDGEVAGSIMRWRDDALDAPEVSYWLGREWWGRGIATAALRQLLDGLPERPLYGRTSSTNPASRQVLERAGFRVVRIDRDVEASDGRLVDELVLRLDA